jgi:hypothetical protein
LVIAAVVLVEVLCRTGVVAPHHAERSTKGSRRAAGVRTNECRDAQDVRQWGRGGHLGGCRRSDFWSRHPPLSRLETLFATYYAIPVYAFYPMFIILFGLGDVPQILIGFMLFVVAVIVNTLSGLDRVSTVLLKTARVYRLGPIATACKIILPSTAPYLLNGVRLARVHDLVVEIVVGEADFIIDAGLSDDEFGSNHSDEGVQDVLIPVVSVLPMQACCAGRSLCCRDGAPHDNASPVSSAQRPDPGCDCSDRLAIPIRRRRLAGRSRQLGIWTNS